MILKYTTSYSVSDVEELQCDLGSNQEWLRTWTSESGFRLEKS